MEFLIQSGLRRDLFRSPRRTRASVEPLRSDDAVALHSKPPETANPAVSPSDLMASFQELCEHGLQQIVRQTRISDDSHEKQPHSGCMLFVGLPNFSLRPDRLLSALFHSGVKRQTPVFRPDSRNLRLPLSQKPITFPLRNARNLHASEPFPALHPYLRCRADPSFAIRLGRISGVFQNHQGGPHTRSFTRPRYFSMCGAAECAFRASRSVHSPPPSPRLDGKESVPRSPFPSPPQARIRCTPPRPAHPEPAERTQSEKHPVFQA